MYNILETCDNCNKDLKFISANWNSALFVCEDCNLKYMIDPDLELKILTDKTQDLFMYSWVVFKDLVYNVKSRYEIDVDWTIEYNNGDEIKFSITLFRSTDPEYEFYFTLEDRKNILWFFDNTFDIEEYWKTYVFWVYTLKREFIKLILEQLNCIYFLK